MSVCLYDGFWLPTEKWVTSNLLAAQCWCHLGSCREAQRPSISLATAWGLCFNYICALDSIHPYWSIINLNETPQWRNLTQYVGVCFFSPLFDIPTSNSFEVFLQAGRTPKTRTLCVPQCSPKPFQNREVRWVLLSVCVSSFSYQLYSIFCAIFKQQREMKITSSVGSCCRKKLEEIG